MPLIIFHKPIIISLDQFAKLMVVEKERKSFFVLRQNFLSRADHLFQSIPKLEKSAAACQCENLEIFHFIYFIYFYLSLRQEKKQKQKLILGRLSCVGLANEDLCNLKNQPLKFWVFGSEIWTSSIDGKLNSYLTQLSNRPNYLLSFDLKRHCCAVPNEARIQFSINQI